VRARSSAAQLSLLLTSARRRIAAPVNTSLSPVVEDKLDAVERFELFLNGDKVMHFVASRGTRGAGDQMCYATADAPPPQQLPPGADAFTAILCKYPSAKSGAHARPSKAAGLRRS
jgi:hypothetical protein